MSDPTTQLNAAQAAQAVALSRKAHLYLCDTADHHEIQDLSAFLGDEDWKLAQSLHFAELVHTLDHEGLGDTTQWHPSRKRRLKRVIQRAIELVKERMNR